MYKYFVSLDDFNMTPANLNLKSFSFDLDTLIDSLTYHKSVNPTCIDMILTNKKNNFMMSTTFECGLSDHHKRTTTILRKNYK